MRERLIRILNNAQLNPSNCQRNIRQMKELYNSSDFEEFLDLNLKLIATVLQQNPDSRYFQNIVQFYTKFFGFITAAVNSNSTDVDDDIEPHPLLEAVLEKVLQFHSARSVLLRQNACMFVSKTLQNLEKLCLNNNLWDLIEEAMLGSINDAKPQVRIQAILALNHLQDPSNPECVIINTLLSFMSDSNPAVRSEIIKILAPNAVTIQQIKSAVRDCDFNVRIQALKRCASLEPKHFKIVDRQIILRSGIYDNCKAVKKTTTDILIPKWLADLKGDHIAFLRAIKLDGDEEDLIITEDLSTKLIEVMFKNEAIDNIIESLALVENKVLPVNKISVEMSLYWKLVTSYIKSNDDTEQLLDRVVPDLKVFSEYIESIVKSKNHEHMDQWEYMELQHILYNLFCIVDIFDLSEEAGRRTLETVLTNILETCRVKGRLLSLMFQIARKLWTNLNTFITNMSEIISNVREPLTEQEISGNDKREKEFQMAEIKVRINILNGDLEDALKAKEFLKADDIQKQIQEYENKLSEQTLTKEVRVVRNDSETVCWCLDLLSEMLKFWNEKEISPTLTMWKVDFLMPLLNGNINPGIEHRMIKCLVLYCLLDRKLADQYLMKFCAMIVCTQNKHTLLVCIEAVSDFIRSYGIDIFNCPNENTTTNTTTTSYRQLYREGTVEIQDSNENLNPNFVVERILDFMDDEDEQIKILAVEAIGKILISDFQATPHLIARLILKLYNPLTEIFAPRLQQRLAIILEQYVTRMKKGREMVMNAVVPALKAIANAPLVSPLKRVDTNSLLKYMTIMTSSDVTENGIDCLHRTLASSLLKELSDHPDEKVSVYFAEMLNLLELTVFVADRELIDQCQTVSTKQELDKSSKNYITKLLKKINEVVECTRERNNIETTNCTEETTNRDIPEKSNSIVEETSNNEQNSTLDENNSHSESSNSSGKTIEKRLIVQLTKENFTTVDSDSELSNISVSNGDSKSRENPRKRGRPTLKNTSRTSSDTGTNRTSTQQGNDSDGPQNQSKTKKKSLQLSKNNRKYNSTRTRTSSVNSDEEYNKSSNNINLRVQNGLTLPNGNSKSQENKRIRVSQSLKNTPTVSSDSDGRKLRHAVGDAETSSTRSLRSSSRIDISNRLQVNASDSAEYQSKTTQRSLSVQLSNKGGKENITRRTRSSVNLGVEFTPNRASLTRPNGIPLPNSNVKSQENKRKRRRNAPVTSSDSESPLNKVRKSSRVRLQKHQQ